MASHSTRSNIYLTTVKTSYDICTSYAGPTIYNKQNVLIMHQTPVMLSSQGASHTKTLGSPLRTK